MIGHGGSRDATSDDAEGNDYEVRSLEEGEESGGGGGVSRRGRSLDHSADFVHSGTKIPSEFVFGAFFPKSCFEFESSFFFVSASSSLMFHLRLGL